MRTKTWIRFVLPAVAALAGPQLHAAGDSTPERNVVSGEIAPKLYYFDYFKGFGTDRTQFLERYNYQKGSDTRSGAYGDVDFSLLVANPERDVLVLERQGFGAFNHRGFLRADSNRLGFAASYSHFRSATGGIDFLYSPNQVPGGTDPAYFFPAGTNTNSGFVARFNDDSGQTLFKIDRTAYGAAIALKPGLLGPASAVLNYDGYKRDGNRFATYSLGGSDVTGGAARVLERWRGFDQPVDETMNRYALNLSGALGGLQLSYDGSLEKFDNSAPEFTVANFAPRSPFIVPSSKPIHFVPDSTLASHQLRLGSQLGNTAVAAGYGHSILDQDSFAAAQQVAGYDRGRITTNSAYLSFNSRLLTVVGLEGFVKYYDRDNDSTFPAPGLIDPATFEQLHVRINRLESLTYGLAATLRATPLRSSVTLGWKREDKDRDLTWSTVSPTLTGIQPQRSLYRQKTLSDELYLKWVARPTPALTVRVTPSYLRADETGLVSEPSESANLKAQVNYAAAANVALGAYYNYRRKKNDNNTFIDALTAPARDGAELAQQIDNTQHSAGASLTLTPTTTLVANISLSWLQSDVSSRFIRTNRRRYEAPANLVLFVTQDAPKYNVDTYVFSVGADLQASAAVRYSGNYSFSKSSGRNASGYIDAALPAVDAEVKSDLHALALRADYAIGKRTTIKASYGYDYYDDKVYRELSGGVHTLMLSLAYRFGS